MSLHSASADTVIGTAIRGSFFVQNNPDLGLHMDFIPSAGLLLKAITSNQEGTYSVNVHVLDNGEFHTYTKTVHITVTSKKLLVLTLKINGKKI